MFVVSPTTKYQGVDGHDLICLFNCPSHTCHGPFSLFDDEILIGLREPKPEAEPMRARSTGYFKKRAKRMTYTCRQTAVGSYPGKEDTILPFFICFFWVIFLQIQFHKLRIKTKKVKIKPNKKK